MKHLKNPHLYIEKKLDFLKNDEIQFEWARGYILKKGYILATQCLNMDTLKRYVFGILSNYQPVIIEKFINSMITAWKRYEGRKNKKNDKIMLNVNISKEHMKKFNSMSDKTMRTKISLLHSLIDENYGEYLNYLKKLKSNIDSKKFLKNVNKEIKNMETIKLNLIKNNLTEENEMLRVKISELEDGLNQLFSIIKTSVVNDSKITAIDSINATEIINSLIIKTLPPPVKLASKK